MKTHLTMISLSCALALTGCAGEIDDSRGDATTATAESAASCKVTAPPRTLGLDPFYTKYCAVYGIPIVASSVVPDAALVQSWHLVTNMLSAAPSLRQELAKAGVRLGVIGEHQVTTDMPEDRNATIPDPGVNINVRTRGIFLAPLASYGEENVLCYESDPYRGENILVHEFGHGIKLVGLQGLDPTFAARAQATYEKAMAAGLFANQYAATNADEYWAEGVQAYFNVHQAPRAGEDPRGTTRDGLRLYDPGLFALLDGAFKGATLSIVCPVTSLSTSATYRIVNEGVAGKSLDVANDGVNAPLLAATSSDSGQRWHLTALGGGRYRLGNEFLGSARSLDVANDGVNDPTMSATGNYSGEEWTFSPVANGQYRMTSAFLGAGRSLAAAASGALHLDTSADYTSQLWVLQSEK